MPSVKAPMLGGKVVKHSRAPIVRVKLTDEVIKEGIVADSQHCMIAVAIALAIPGAIYISVDLQTIRFSVRERYERYTYLTPRSLQNQRSPRMGKCHTTSPRRMP